MTNHIALQESKTIGDLLKNHSALSGDSSFAFFSEEKAVTASDLDELANSIAVHLSDLKVSHGARVVILSKPGHLQIASLMACWKLGAVVSPVDRFISPGELSHIVRVFQPSLTLIDPGLEAADVLSESAVRAGSPVDHPQTSKKVLADSALPLVSENDLALCLFTSGSTGIPKGVLLSHGSLITGAVNVVLAKGISSEDRVLCVLPLSHMNGLVTTFLAPLLSGGSVVYMQNPFSPHEALSLIDTYECTWFSATPMHYALMLSPPVEKKYWSLTWLRFCRSASSPLPARILNEFEEHYGVPIIETMGTTETAGQIFSNPLPPSTHKPASIGFPVNFDVQLVNDVGKLCGENEPGEMLVRGDALMLGYLDDPDETDKALDMGWLRTGDIAICDEEGYYFIKGRKKDIAIFCGINISLRDLETTVHEKKLVFDVACKGEEHPIFGETVVIYAIPKSEDDDLTLLSAKLCDLVKPKLPNVQAIKEIRCVDNFPRSNVGKVLKGRLSECEILHSSRGSLSKEPRYLLSQVLDIPIESVHDDLRLGSIAAWDSLRYVALLAAVESVLDRKLSKLETDALITFKGLQQVLSGELHGIVCHSHQNAKTVHDIVGKLTGAGYGDSRVNYLIIGFDFCMGQGIRNPEYFLDALTDVLSAEQNLIMNAFTWKFCKGENYHHIHTPSEMGMLNELFRRREDTVRGNHPIYSYIAMGPDAADLVYHSGTTCWNEGSSYAKRCAGGHIRITASFRKSFKSKSSYPCP